MAIGLFGYKAAWGGFFPLVFVNFLPIYSNEIDRDLSLAYTYYQNAMIYSGGDPTKLESRESYNELKRAVIDEAISREIIYRELESIMGRSEIDEISGRNIEKALDGRADTEEGVEKLYGLNLEDFKAQILLPQARKEILEGRMTLKNLDFNSWLGKTRSESSIMIFSSVFGWDGERVVLN